MNTSNVDALNRQFRIPGAMGHPSPVPTYSVFRAMRNKWLTCLIQSWLTSESVTPMACATTSIHQRPHLITKVEKHLLASSSGGIGLMRDWNLLLQLPILFYLYRPVPSSISIQQHTCDIHNHRPCWSFFPLDSPFFTVLRNPWAPKFLEEIHLPRSAAWLLFTALFCTSSFTSFTYRCISYNHTAHHD